MDGNFSKHWFKMSYIGRACINKHGKRVGVFMETVWAVPHYLGVGMFNVIGYTIYVARIPFRKES
jgi:hypothetical protein